jgi:hypothetical protein
MSYFIPDQSAFDKEDDDNMLFPKEYTYDTVRDSATILEKDGYTYYIIPENTKVYRGLPKHATSFYTRNKGPTFFTSTIAGCMQYGFPHEYNVISTIKLLALDNDKNKDKLREEYGNRSDIMKILHNQYGKYRNSSTKEDTLFSDFLCSIGFEGYMTLQHKTLTDFGGSFHTEIVLCPSYLEDKISHVGEINIQDKDKDNDKDKFVKYITDNVSKRNNIDSLINTPPRKKKMKFESPVKTTQSRNLFSTPGGGKRRTRNRRTGTKRYKTAKKKI